MERERKKENGLGIAEEVPDFCFNMIEVTAAMNGGITDQKNAHGI